MKNDASELNCTPLWFEELIESKEVLTEESYILQTPQYQSMCTPTLWSDEKCRIFITFGNKAYELSISREKEQILLEIIKEIDMTMSDAASVPLALEVGNLVIPLEEFLKLNIGDVLCFNAESPLKGIIRCGQIHIGYGRLEINKDEVTLKIEEIFSQPIRQQFKANCEIEGK